MEPSFGSNFAAVEAAPQGVQMRYSGSLSVVDGLHFTAIPWEHWRCEWTDLAAASKDENLDG